VGICEPLPGLTVCEARQIIQGARGGLAEITVTQILMQTGDLAHSLSKMLEQLGTWKKSTPTATFLILFRWQE